MSVKWVIAGYVAAVRLTDKALFSFWVIISKIAVGVTQLPSLISPRVDRLKCEAGHSLPSSVEVKTTLKFTLSIRDSSVGVGTGYGLDCQGLIPGKGKRFFSTPQSSDRLRGPPSLLYNGYRRLFPQG
jgi:hypothetical protein